MCRTALSPEKDDPLCLLCTACVITLLFTSPFLTLQLPDWIRAWGLLNQKQNKIVFCLLPYNAESTSFLFFSTSVDIQYYFIIVSGVQYHG